VLCVGEQFDVQTSTPYMAAAAHANADGTIEHKKHEVLLSRARCRERLKCQCLRFDKWDATLSAIAHPPRSQCGMCGMKTPKTRKMLAFMVLAMF